MEDSAVRFGKFFHLRHKSMPNFLLEVEDGATDEGTLVTVSEPELFGRESVDYQLWFLDRTSHTIRTKLNDFCMHVNDDGLLVVKKFVRGNVKQRWFINNDQICCHGQHELSVGVDGDVCAGAKCRVASDNTNSFWLIDHHAPLYMYIMAHSDPKLVLDIRAADCKPGAKVILYGNKGDLSDNQLWYEDENGVLHSKMNGYAIDATGKELTMQPYSKTSTHQQWIISEDKVRNATKLTQLLQLKPGNVFSSTSVVAVDAPSDTQTSHQLWFFEYIPHQTVSLNHSGCGKYFVIASRISGLVLQVDGKIIEAGSEVTLTVKDNSDAMRQHFCQDEMTGTIRSALRNYCLEIDKAGNLVINPFDPNEKMQQWVFGERKIQNRHSPNLVLQVTNNNSEGGRQITVGEYAGSEQQHWDICHVPARCFYIVSRWNGKVLDVRGDEASAGASVIVFDRKPSIAANQVWYEDELGLLRSKLNGYVIDTSAGEAFLRPFEPSNVKQHWTIVGDRIQNKYESGLVLDIYGKSSSKVGEYKFNGDDNQLWTFEMVR